MRSKRMPAMTIKTAHGEVVLPAGWRAPYPVSVVLDYQTQNELEQRGVNPQAVCMKLLDAGWRESIRSYVTYWVKKYVKLYGPNVIDQDSGHLLGFDAEVLMVYWTPSERKYGVHNMKDDVYNWLRTFSELAAEREQMRLPF